MADVEGQTKQEVLSARVPSRVRDLVRAAASARGRSVSAYVATKVEEGALEDLNDTYGRSHDRVRATA